MLFILLLSSHLVSSHTFCGGDSVEINPPSFLLRKTARSTTLAPIRISFFYVDFNLNDATLTTTLTSTLLPAIASYFSRTLNVYSVQGNLILTSTCSGKTLPSSHTTTGIPNTDVAAYLTTTTSSTATYIAAAGACQLQSDKLNNVIAGLITVNPTLFSKSNFQEWIAVFTHEMTHMLGFSNSLVKYWKNKAGSAYASGEVIQNISVRGVYKNVLKSPQVLNKARSVFGCSTLQGVELEDIGSSGMHWDRRIMMFEYMISDLSNEPYWSSITLAALDDTGWYTVDYSLALDPIPGKNIGCDFFDSPCLSNGVSSNTHIWCDKQTTYSCDALSLNKGSCLIKTYSANLPDYFQYFSSPNSGGADSYTDYCPYVQHYSNGLCRRNDIGSTSMRTTADEVVGRSSRCFVSTLDKTYTSVFQTFACYKVDSCTSTSAIVIIGTQKLECPFTGGSFSVPGYYGTITCPSSDILCQDVPCVNMCYGRGICSKGLCNCLDGFGGTDCSVVCGDNCKSCNENGCLACLDPYTLNNGACLFGETEFESCEFGYFFEGVCIPCSPPCLTCTSTSCTSYYTDCAENCEICFGEECTLCGPGFQLVEKNECRPIESFGRVLAFLSLGLIVSI